MDDLAALKIQTETYIGNIFDHVSSLGHNHLLGQLYDFQVSIEGEIKRVTTKQGDN